MNKRSLLYYILVIHIVGMGPLEAIQTARSVARIGRTLPTAIQKRFISGAPKWATYEKNAHLSVAPQILPEAQAEPKNAQYKKYGAASLGAAAAGLGGYSLYNYFENKPLRDKNNAIRAIQALEKEDQTYSKLQEKLDAINDKADMRKLFLEYTQKSSAKTIKGILDYIKINKEDVFIKALTDDDDPWFYVFDWLRWVDKLQAKNATINWFEQNPHYFLLLLKKIDVEKLTSDIDDEHTSFEFKRFIEALPYILEICNNLIKTKEYRETIIGFIKILHQVSLKFNEKRMNFIEKNMNLNKYPAIMRSLQEDQFNNKSLLLLLKRNKADALKKFYNDLRNDPKTNIERQSQKKESLSGKHLRKFASEKTIKFDHYKENELKGPALYQFSEALKKENELLNNGYICFYHGQEQEYALTYDISTQLIYRLAEKIRPNDFTSLRFRPEDFKKIKNNTKKAIIAIDEDQKRLMKGPKYKISNSTEEKAKVVSLNVFAFGNVNNEGSNTWNYVKHNNNVLSFNSSFNKINVFNQNLKLFGIPEYLIKKIDERFKKLIELNNSIYKTGHLILVAIPSNMVDDTVYTNIYKEYKGRFEGNRRIPIELATKTLHSMSEVIETLYDESLDIPFEHLDSFECTMPLTAKEALNPNSGIKYLHFDNKISLADQKRIDGAKEAFIADIIKLLEEAGVLKKSQEISKNYLKLLDEISKSSA